MIQIKPHSVTQKMSLHKEASKLTEVHYRLLVLVNTVSKSHCGTGWEFNIDAIGTGLTFDTMNIDIYYHSQDGEKELSDIYNSIKVGRFLCISGSVSIEDVINKDTIRFLSPSYAIVAVKDIPAILRNILIEGLCENKLKYERVDKWGEEYLESYVKSDLFDDVPF